MKTVEQEPISHASSVGATDPDIRRALDHARM